jgi:hypothetical protein
MQIVIDIDEEDKQKIDRCLKGEGMEFRREFDLLKRIVLAVFHGQVLPKNHGPLIDQYELEKRRIDYVVDGHAESVKDCTEFFKMMITAPVLIDESVEE